MAYSDLDSAGALLKNQEVGGMLLRDLGFGTAAGFTLPTLATTGSGYIGVSRSVTTFTVPSVSSPYSGWLLDAKAFTEDSARVYVVALEYDLGSLAVSTNTFTAGTDATMPTKTLRINGVTYSNEQTASMLTVVVATVAVTATTPTLTITYVNDDGTGSRTATMTLPTSPAINSGFDMMPHLQSGDLGVQDVTNMSISTGSAGTLKVKGLLPISWNMGGSSNVIDAVASIRKLWPRFIATSGEKVAFYNFCGTASTADLKVRLVGIPV